MKRAIDFLTTALTDLKKLAPSKWTLLIQIEMSQKKNPRTFQNGGFLSLHEPVGDFQLEASS
jgi:hypothetical protein